MRRGAPVRQLFVSTAALAIAFFGAQPVFAQVQGQWTSAGTMQSAREFDAQARLSNGSVLAIGGVDNTGAVLGSAEIDSPADNNWALTGSMASARQLFDAVELTNGNVLVAGGIGTGGVVLGTAELYNPATRTWSSAGSLSVARFNHSATLLKSGKVLVTGGCTVSDCSVETGVSELYDPATNTWSKTGSLNTARAYHHAVRLNDGRVLAIGGSTAAAMTSCELYHPSTGVWSAAASTNAPRFQSAASLLPNGKVLVTGGAITRFPLNTAELYDPVANTWTTTGNMTVGRYAHAATPLPDGAISKIRCQPADQLREGLYGIHPDRDGRDLQRRCRHIRARGQSQSAACLSRRDAAGVGTRVDRRWDQHDQHLLCRRPRRCVLHAADANLLQHEPELRALADRANERVADDYGENVSSHAAVFAGIAASGDYAETNDCTGTLEPGQQCTISITFSPKVAGMRNGAITLTDNSPGSPTQTIDLSGTGEKLALGFTPASINVGGVAVGSSGTAIAVLTNDGVAPVAISGIAIVPANRTFTQTNTCPAALAVQKTCTIQIVFKPPDVFEYDATLSVTNNAGSPATLPLSGVGLDGS